MKITQFTKLGLLAALAIALATTGTSSAQVVLSSDFSGTSKDGTTMNDITWTTGGILTPDTSATVVNTIQTAGNGNLFTTPDTDGVFAPANNTSNGGAWNMTVSFTTLGSPIGLQDFELTYRHFNGAGITQNVLRDANYTVEIRDSSDTVLPGSNSTINTDNVNTTAMGPQTIVFDLTGVTLAANTEYTLFVEAADSDGPAGNNTGFDAITLNSTGGVLPSPAFRITDFQRDVIANTVTLTWDSQPDQTFAVLYSPDLLNWDADLNDGQPAAPNGTSTTQTYDLTNTGVESLSTVFFRIELIP